ncbi:RHS repeat-associated core domain-containing protein [Pseudomonas soli]|uniref:RHS repeat-associated core domain-containing protein n=1 Tax=Pseudomonas soli TaxID=1306993 RepID=UPI00380D6928
MNDKWSKVIRTFHVHDAITGEPLNGSPLSFIFGDESTQDKWPALVRAKLEQHGLDAFLRLGTATSVNGDINAEKTIDFWQLDKQVRIFIAGFEETDKTNIWSCALRNAIGGESTLAQALEAFIQAPEGGIGKREVQCALHDKHTRRVIHQWTCTLDYIAGEDALSARVKAFADSIDANIQIQHIIHDSGEVLTSRSDKTQTAWTLKLPAALDLELTVSDARTHDAANALSTNPGALLMELATPYLISTQPNGYLPDMSDFALERVGSLEGGWSSCSTIKAGRALSEGEVLSAFLIDRLDGDIRRIDYTPPKEKLTAALWPKAFAEHLATAGEAITAGAWSDTNTFSTATKPLRLWSPVRYRAFSTAPFAGNIVQVLACDDSFSPSEGVTLCLQVRDVTAQALYEHHFFTPTAAQAGDNWSQALCEQINRDSRLLRAGVLDGCSVTPAKSGNAFWAPQCAELCVTLTEARWWQSQAVESAGALKEGQTVQAWVYDAFSHRLLAKHEWAPTAAQRAAGKWQAAWAHALNASSVAPYLRVATHNPQAEIDDEADNLHLWQRGDALRIFTSLPDAANRLPGPDLKSVWKNKIADAVLVTVRHPASRKLLHRALFKPQDGADVTDKSAWLQAMANFLKQQAWPEVQVGAVTAPLCVPRYSELQITLDNVGDGETWSDGDYVKYLLETDDWPGRTPAEKATFNVTSADATVQVSVQSLNGELEFRLDKAAHDKGYRIAACVPRPNAHPQWPVEVTETKVTWAGPIDNQDYDLHLTYPESARDSTKLTVGHIGAFHPTRFWHTPKAVEFTPPAPMAAYTPSSFLCEDYGNTNHSEVFDTSHHHRTGVDERSGLFHAHYPIATLQGLLGLGPVCDLTLHYSALRANEAGLGDGWAWRFSRMITSAVQANDHRLLTLADGPPVYFSEEQWKSLGEGKAVRTKACRVSCTKDYSTFTIEFPSGRQEILSKPTAAGSDEVEPNEAFRQTVLGLLKAIKSRSYPADKPADWTQYVLMAILPTAWFGATALDFHEAVRVWEKHANTKELDKRIAQYERPFVQLLPSRIVSQYGEALDLEWKRQQGQFQLMSIKSGGCTLFSAEYLTPSEAKGSQVNMQLWPGTDEAFTVELHLKDYLLRTLKRVQNKTVLQQVDCGYDDDPTLDRVLCRLEELDGSVECVQYKKEDAQLKGSPALPRVTLHALLPGHGQQNHIDRYTYTGSFQHPDDQLFISQVRTGTHASIVHELHCYGLDEQGNRTPQLRGSGDSSGHSLEFSLRQERTTMTFKYNGWGDELAEVVNNIVIKLDGSQFRITADAPAMERRDAVLQLLWTYSTKNRRLIHEAIKGMLSLASKAQRESLGKTVEATTVVTDALDRPIRLYVAGSHSIHYCYYHAAEVMLHDNKQGNWLAQKVSELLGEVPTLECPFVPDYADAPLMAEYQCDDYGNPQSLKLYSYRKVTRDAREYLELADFVIIEGLKGSLTNDILDQHANWELTGFEALDHRITTASTVPERKKTSSKESKVVEWSITNKQVTHHSGQTLEVTHVQKFVDNPNAPGIQVTVSTTTAGGTTQVSSTLRSRYSRRALQHVENGLETHFMRDASGRVTQEARYRLATGSTGKSAKRAVDERITSAYSADGTQVTHSYLDGSQRLEYLDGLQRSWRSLWRRSATEGYVPIDECCFTDLDESVLGSWSWDYLPGGQAVRKDSPLRSFAGRCPWLKQEIGEASAKPALIGTDNIVVNKLPTPASVTDRSSRLDSRTFVFAVLACIEKMDRKRVEYKENSKQELTSIGKTCLHLIQLEGRFNVKIENPSRLFKALQSLAGLGNADWLDEITSDLAALRPSWSLDKQEIAMLDCSGDVNEIIELFSVELRSSGKFFVTARKIERALAEALNYSAKTELTDALLPPTEDLTIQVTEQSGLGPQCLSTRSTTTKAYKEGDFERTLQWKDDTGKQQLQVKQHHDSNGHITSHTRTVGEQTQAYALSRDFLGRITEVGRPDGTVIERTYHGFSNQVTELTVDGKVMATQTLTDSGKLQSRKVGSREYGFADQAVTLPDKTRLQTLQDADGARLQAGDNALYSTTQEAGATVVSAAPEGKGWRHTFASAQVPGRRSITEKTPRGTVVGHEWQTLRGQRIATRRANGRWQRVFTDSEERVLRTCEEHEDVVYRYDELGRLQARQAHALTGEGQWQVHSEWDGFNCETVRTFLRNGVACFSQQLAWRGDGRLESKASYQDGKLLRTERFTYDELDRLASYACDAKQAALCPQDSNGTPIKAQTFTWDAFDNLTQCTSTPFDGDAVTETFTFDSTADPTRLTSLKTGKQTTRLKWNSNGHLEADTQKRALTYNAAGQLDSVKDAKGALLARYEYDALQRLAMQYSEHDQTTRELRYDGDELIGQVCFDKAGEATRSTCISPGLAQYDDNQVRWLIDDPQVGIVGQVLDGELQLAPLLPFGEGASLEGVVNGYNGMRRDPVTGQYHAGNGYRCYDPALRRYAQPDWLSPFGEGGINDYAHCPDPVNLHDPSGAIMLSRWGQDQELGIYQQALRETQPMPVGGRWRGIALSVALTVVGVAASVMSGGAASAFFMAMTTCAILSCGFEVAAALTEDSNPELSRKLGHASLVFGVLSLFESALGLIKKLPTLIKNGMRTMRQLGKALRMKVRTWRAPNRVRPTGLPKAREAWTQMAPKTRQGFLAKAMDYAERVLDYLGHSERLNFSRLAYTRAGLLGKPLQFLHHIHSLAILPRGFTAAAWVTGKAVEAYIVQGSVFAIIAWAKNDSSGPASLWGRYSVPMDQHFRWSHGGGGHLLS